MKMEILNEIRIDSERTQTVMNDMGVDPDIDLKVLHYKDFISAGLTPQIVKMRYQAYVDRIVQTVTEIIFRRSQLVSCLEKVRRGKFKPISNGGFIHPSIISFNDILELRKGIEKAMRSRQQTKGKPKSVSRMSKSPLMLNKINCKLIMINITFSTRYKSKF